MNYKPLVKFITFGCKVNQYDSEALKNIFRDWGYDISQDKQDRADVIVINTCTVTHLADRKARQNIRKHRRQNPEAIIAVTGCYVQTDPQEITNLSEIDVFQGTTDRSKLVEMVEKIRKGQVKGQLQNITWERPKGSFEPLTVKNFDTNRSRHFMKIQEGCDHFCSYCIVPYARGEIRSREPVDIFKEVKEALQAGFKEIVLTGVNLAAYGRERSDLPNLLKLIQDIIALPEDFRIRLSSCEPQELSYELIDLVTDSNKICSHLHIPLQSGDDDILFAMNRDYTTKEFLDLVTYAKAKDADMAITSDVIVGFPGETDQHFINTKSFISRAEFSDIHVFQYSPRKNTEAQWFSGQVHSRVKKERSDILITLSNELRERYHQKFIGDTVPVLVEYQSDRIATGISDRYARVKFSPDFIFNKKYQDHVRQIYYINIENADEDFLYGFMVYD